jgi:cobalamin biosynthesis Mg chelatase CobN
VATPDASAPNNHRRNYPVIIAVTRSNATGFTTIFGAFDNDPNETHTIQCFVGAPRNPVMLVTRIPRARNATVRGADMRRSFLLALSVSLVALAFATTAMAQNNYQGGGNQRMNSGGMGNMGVDHSMMASPASDASATAMSGATASPSSSPSTAPSASPSASSSASAPVASATSSAAPSKELPDTGGIPLAPLLSVGALVLLAGSGVFASRLTR